MLDMRLLGGGIAAMAVVLLIATASSTLATIRLNEELHKSCTLPEGVCPFKRSIPAESAVSFIFGGGLLLTGGYLFVNGKSLTKAGTGMADAAKLRKVAAGLEGDEKKLYGMILAAQGLAWQSELVAKSGLNKVAVTRTLDKLEGKGLIERRRRGMANVVILRHAA